MKKITLLLGAILTLNISLSAQKNEEITVKAGTRVIDYFPVGERYRYPEFITGKVYFNSGTINTTKLNYNILAGEMEFIQSRDTLSIYRKKDIKFVAIEKDTFFYDNGYLEMISRSPVRVYLKQYVKLKAIVKKDSYGTSSSGGASNSLGSMSAEGKFYTLTASSDMILQKMRDYYLYTQANGFVPFRKKAVMQLYPQHEDEIKDYLKSNDINFNSGDDLIKLAGFLGGLKN